MIGILRHPVIEENAGFFWRRPPHWIMQLCPVGKMQASLCFSLLSCQCSAIRFRFSQMMNKSPSTDQTVNTKIQAEIFCWSFAGCTPAHLPSSTHIVGGSTPSLPPSLSYIFVLKDIPLISSSITNKMQRYTILFIITNALYVSGGSSAHHQELKTVYTASGICRAVII
jgi:hypothetical protein